MVAAASIAIEAPAFTVAAITWHAKSFETPRLSDRVFIRLHVNSDLRPTTSPSSGRPLRSTAILALALSLFAAVSGASAALNSQEQQIASYMVNDSHQGRALMVLDPILAGVA